MDKKIFTLILVLAIFCNAYPQHQHNMPGMSKEVTKPKAAQKKKPMKKMDMASKDTTMMGKDSMMMDMKGDHNMELDMGNMSHAFSLNLPMSRNGSGTGWLPDASPMYGSMYHSKKWMYMLHGSAWLRYNNQDLTNKGSRGDSGFDGPTWFMFMAQRKVGLNGLFHFSSMFSLDPVIEGGRGYPLLFQTGESYKGQPLVDRQHPHDLFSELSIAYSHAFSKNTDVFLYLAYPGEPALGPVTFMHRPSSLDNPNSPISHHWVDATHITFGVATLGARFGKFKIEGSSFTGREPDEYRYGFDKPRFDSWSGRLSFNPSENWALQVSHGYTKSPEELHPDENIHKTTASAIYSISMGDENQINATALWGMNKQKGNDGENAILLEGAWRKMKNSLYARYEWAQKSSEELALEPVFEGNVIFPIRAFTIGDNYDLFNIGKMRLAGGAQWSIYHTSESLNTLYGKTPMALQIFLRLYPSLMKM